MAVQLNHTIVPVTDKEVSARFLAEILGLDPPQPFGPFLCLETANGVSLDYDDRGLPEHHHYAFLVTEEEFDDDLPPDHPTWTPLLGRPGTSTSESDQQPRAGLLLRGSVRSQHGDIDPTLW